MMRFVFAATEEAGALSLDYFRSDLGVDNKASGGLFDPVTEADRAVERRLRELLGHEFSEHSVLGEEYGFEDKSSDYCWVIDPIDGTRSFITGVPAWGILLGLKYKGEPVLGALHQPYLKETFIAHNMAAASEAWFMRGEFEQRAVLQTSDVSELSKARLACTHPEIFADYNGTLARFERVAELSQLMRYGGDCYCYAMLAMGQNDLVIETGLNEYDIVPLVPIIEAAGGVITDWQGQPVRGAGHVVAAATKALHQEAMAALNGE